MEGALDSACGCVRCRERLRVPHRIWRIVAPQYRGRDWSAIAADARQQWEGRNPNSWDEAKDSVRYAWERARGGRLLDRLQKR